MVISDFGVREKHKISMRGLTCRRAAHGISPLLESRAQPHPEQPPKAVYRKPALSPQKRALMGPRTAPAPLRLANHRHSGESRNEEQKLRQALADRPMSLSEVPVPVRMGSMDFVGADLCVRPPRMPIATASRRAEIRKLGGHTGPPLQFIRLGITSPLALDALHHRRHSGESRNPFVLPLFFYFLIGSHPPETNYSLGRTSSSMKA